MEAANARGPIVDAVDELHIPDRTLYLLDTAGIPIEPAHARARIRDSAVRAAHGPPIWDAFDAGNEHTISIHAERFLLDSGQPMIAVVAADQLELADRYAALIAAFGGVALAAIVLVAGGGDFLVPQGAPPARRALANTRRVMAGAAHQPPTPRALPPARAGGPAHGHS